MATKMTSHEVDSIIPRGIASSIPVTIIASIRCLIRYDESAPVISCVLVLHINEMINIPHKSSRAKMRQ